MPTLRSSVHVQFDTDFALLGLSQAGYYDSPSPGTFATSEPGCVAMCAGTKYAELDVRVEYWDAQPPPSVEQWDERDTVPWLTRNGPASLEVNGFEPIDGSELSIEGLTSGRVEVLARGRALSALSESADDDSWHRPPVEHWLIRLWADTGPGDALKGDPRRLHERPDLPSPGSDWRALIGLPDPSVAEQRGYASPMARALSAYRPVSEDLVHLARWTPRGVISASPREVGQRLDVSSDDVLGGLRFLAAVGHHVDPLPTPASDPSSAVYWSAEIPQPPEA